MQLLYLITLLLITFNVNAMDTDKTVKSEKSLTVSSCQDFELNGKGDHQQWQKAEWVSMTIRDDAEDEFETKFKMLYSEKGIYLLSFCEDNMISTEYTNDQDDIWNADVFEVFFHTDPTAPLYFEYEINPLNTELVLLIPNDSGKFMGWAPWHYEGDRKIRKAVYVQGGKSEPGAKISSWTAEIFFPFELLKGFKNVPPKSGTKWTGNFYRMDFDTGKRISWSWAPVNVSFHEYKKFWTIIFK